jgi:transposase
MIKHSDEFKQEAVRIALASGLPRARVAADLGIGKSTLGKWIADRRPSVPSTVPQSDLALENERLRQENRVLKEERDILKKATQFFAKERP